MWKLVIEDDEGKRTVVPLTRDEYTIGRKEGNSIRLTERNVSRDHAKLSKRPGPTKDKPIFTLGDVSSYNGVYVNGLRVADKQELQHGDLIQIGDYRVVLQDETAEATDTADPGEPIALDAEDLKDTVSAAPSPLRATNATFLEKPNRLVVLAGPNPGEEFPLVGDRLTIGRAEDATISVNHNSVSRLHCEVHALGDARFEIVGKGSSNGVRVNGADLRRGIIEAGDVIELGDVKFKFVGEGQLFRPGTESQQLATLSPRTATAVVQVRPSGNRSLVPAVLLGAALAVGVIGVYFLKMRQPHVDPAPPEASAPVTAVDTTGADAAMLADARRMCDVGDVEGAHEKASQLPAGSSLHASGDFKYIEATWSSRLMVQSESESEPAAKATLLRRLTGDLYADPAVRKLANDRLQALEQAPAAAASVASPPHEPGHHGSSVPTPLPHTQTFAVNPPPTTPTPPPPATPRPSARQSPSELAASPNPTDWQKARDILENKVFAHRGSADEVRLLKAICKNQHDPQCVADLKTINP